MSDVFSKQELETLSNGLLSLMENVNRAERALNGVDLASHEAMEKYRNGLIALNGKVCKMM